MRIFWGWAADLPAAAETNPEGWQAARIRALIGCGTPCHNLPKIQQPREPEPSTINEKTIADFTRVVEQTGILEREPTPPD